METFVMVFLIAIVVVPAIAVTTTLVIGLMEIRNHDH